MSLQIPTLISNIPNLTAPSLSSQPVISTPAPPNTPTITIPTDSNVKKVVILHTIDIKKEDLGIMSSYGKVVEYDILVEGNKDINTLQFDYLLLDLRQKKDRIYFDSNDTSNFNVVCYISKIEQFDKCIDDLSVVVITEFPSKQHFKVDWDNLLMKTAKTKSPSKCLSFFTFLSSYFPSLRK